MVSGCNLTFGKNFLSLKCKKRCVTDIYIVLYYDTYVNKQSAEEGEMCDIMEEG